MAVYCVSDFMAQLRTNKLHEQLAARLCRDIVSGRLVADAAIPSEPELVVEYGVSKTVVRETVQALAAVGVVRVHHGKRTTVLPESEWDILSHLVQEAFRAEGLAGSLIQELYEVRHALEPAAARWTAERARPADLEEIRRCVQAMDEVIANSTSDRVERYLELDRDFHMAIASAASNRVLRAIVRDIDDLLTINWLLTVLSDGDLEVAHQLHVEIAEAILGRDPDAAEESMRAHLEWAAQIDRRPLPRALDPAAAASGSAPA
jgi:DNA-binding FadR family transcriptional regulator